MGLFKWLGNALNDITGVTGSANQQYNNSMALQHDAQEFNKHAHQYEVADLQAAGLNPVLSAGGQGTSSAGMNGASTGSAAADPISLIGQVISMVNSTKQTNADIKKTNAEAENLNADTKLKGQTFEWTPELNASLIRLQTATNNKEQAIAEKTIVETAAQQFVNKMREMDVKKRSSQWDRELEIYKAQMAATLRDSGTANTTAGIMIENLGKVINAMSPLTNFVPSSGNSYNVNSPTVNY